MCAAMFRWCVRFKKHFMCPPLPPHIPGLRRLLQFFDRFLWPRFARKTFLEVNVLWFFSTKNFFSLWKVEGIKIGAANKTDVARKRRVCKCEYGCAYVFVSVYAHMLQERKEVTRRFRRSKSTESVYAHMCVQRSNITEWSGHQILSKNAKQEKTNYQKMRTLSDFLIIFGALFWFLLFLRVCVCSNYDNPTLPKGMESPFT